MFLETCIINGFCCLNHTSEIQDSHDIKYHICSFKFQKEPITLQCGAGITRTLLYSDWQEECNDLLRQFYTSDGEFIEVITVPDTTGNVGDSSLRNKVINTFKNWCNLSSNPLGLVVANYDIVSNLLFHGATEAAVKEALSVNKFPTDNERLIVYNAFENIMITVRLTSNDINEKLFDCVNDVKLLTLLLKEELHESGVKIAGLLVYEGNDKSRHCVQKCAYCNTYIVTPEIFQSTEFFQKFWKKYAERRKFHKIESELPKGRKVDTFGDVASKILGHMARHKTNTLPKVIQNDPAKTIGEAELLLDRYQMEIAYSQQNRIVLKGEYGTGKTVIALKKIQLLLETLKDKEVIYYINFNGRSELHGAIKQKLTKCCKSSERVKVIGGSQNLSNIIESKILPVEEKIGVEKVNLIVDEYASENLTKKEANTLHEIFEEKKQFKNSTILIATQPIRIDRQVIFNGNKEKYSEEGHMFHMLNTFKIYNLKYIMRTTVQINALAKITQDYLNSKSNEYIRLRRTQKNEPSGKIKSPSKLSKWKKFLSVSNTIRNPFTHKNIPALPRASTFSVTSSQPKNISALPRASTFSVTSSQPKNISVLPRASTFYVALSPPPTISQTAFADSLPTDDIIDNDELQKITSSRNTQNVGNNQRIMTTYHFPCKSKIGHGIYGPLPQVIHLPPSANQFEQVALIGMFLKHIFEKLDSKRIVIVHFEPGHSFWLKWLLERLSFLSSLKVTGDVKEFLDVCYDNIVLLKNYTFLKGLEFPNVILILDSNEYYLKQFIPEAMTRCQSYLSIIVKKSENIRENDTVANLVKFWYAVNAEEGKSIINTIQINYCSKALCNIKTDHEKDCCTKTVVGDVVISYDVHKNCKFYKSLLKYIEVERPLDMEPVEELIQEKANTM